MSNTMYIVWFPKVASGAILKSVNSTIFAAAMTAPLSMMRSTIVRYRREDDAKVLEGDV